MKCSQRSHPVINHQDVRQFVKATAVHQYLDTGSQAVWAFYPTLKLVEIHDVDGIRESLLPRYLSKKSSLEESRSRFL